MVFAFAAITLLFALFVTASILSRVQELNTIWDTMLINAQGDRLLRLKAWSLAKEKHGNGMTLEQACTVLEDMQIRGIR